MATKHYNNLTGLIQIDGVCMQQGNFSKSDGDYDRQRRYQAEFLVRKEIPLDMIDSINVYNQDVANYVTDVLGSNNIDLAVNIVPTYFF